MLLSHYIQDMDRRKALAKAVACSPCYLWQIAANYKNSRGYIERPSASLSVAIEAATDRLVTVEELRSDLKWFRGDDGRVIAYERVAFDGFE